MKLMLAALAGLLVAAPAAHAGAPITGMDPCPDQGARYASPADAATVKRAVLCVISEVRQAQGLPALKLDARLARSAQRHATGQARAGTMTHGRIADIPKRIARAGYRAAALNEGLGLGAPDSSAYDLVGVMVQGGACSQILDPRFRDAGVGVSVGRLRGMPGPRFVRLVVHFGLKAGAKPPSSKRRPAATCPHALPEGGRLEPADERAISTVQGATITVRLRCAGKTGCDDEVTLKLLPGDAAQTRHVTLAAGRTTALAFTFTEAEVAAALAGRGLATIVLGGRNFATQLRPG